jgi:hypothetical protein
VSRIVKKTELQNSKFRASDQINVAKPAFSKTSFKNEKTIILSGATRCTRARAIEWY